MGGVNRWIKSGTGPLQKKKKKRGEREISEKKGAGITWMHRKK